MTNNFLSSISSLILMSLILGSVSCMAAESSQSDTAVSGAVTLVSDYIWRGQSQTWGEPALQLGIEASHVAGAYAGFWASNDSDQWVPGAHLETDWYAGFRSKFPGALAEVGYDLNVNYAYFPGANFDKTGFNLPSAPIDTVEVYAAANYRWLSIKAGQVLTKFYGWDETNSGPGGFPGDPDAGVTGSTKGSYFVEANLSQNIAEGWNLNGQIGNQFIKNSTGLDWRYYKIGLTRTMDAWAIAMAWSASSEPNAFRNFLGLKNNGSIYSPLRSTIVFSVARNF